MSATGTAAGGTAEPLNMSGGWLSGQARWHRPADPAAVDAAAARSRCTARQDCAVSASGTRYGSAAAVLLLVTGIVGLCC